MSGRPKHYNLFGEMDCKGLPSISLAFEQGKIFMLHTHTYHVFSHILMHAKQRYQNQTLPKAKPGEKEGTPSFRTSHVETKLVQ